MIKLCSDKSRYHGYPAETLSRSSRSAGITNTEACFSVDDRIPGGFVPVTGSTGPRGLLPTCPSCGQNDSNGYIEDNVWLH
ncbi:unnamed protein product [Phytophthora lilii]|uniref:Unnamed protein product n=1 Tax=Phytophthora lilii TaxID=2077276 RepID=A0A9W6TSB8_9STRA|nr:unnamed protein product [Phytophthora lilii]